MNCRDVKRLLKGEPVPPEPQPFYVTGMAENRYYVRRIETGFEIRERQTLGTAASSRDRLIHTFSIDQREDAHAYAKIANDLQRELDDLYGMWIKHAV